MRPTRTRALRRSAGRPAAVVMAAALIATTMVGLNSPAAVAADAVPRVLGDFEAETAPWAPVGQGGAQSSLSRTTEAARSGAASAQWDVEVPTGGLAAIGLDVGNLDATALRFSVLTDSADEIVVRLRDVTGQTHQQSVAVTPSAGQWTDIVVTEFDGGTGYSFFGGAADGVWHGPLTRVSLVLTPSQLVSPPGGTVFVDDVSVDIPAPEFAIRPTVLGNVFDEGQPVTVGIDTTAEHLAWRVFDHDGGQVASGGASVSDLGGEIAFGSLGIGWYQAEITVTRHDGTVFAAGTDLAVLPAADPVKDLRRGVGTHYGASESRRWDIETVPLIARAGFGFARDAATWNQQETVKGQIEFTPKALAYTAAFADADLDFMNILSYGNQLYHPDEVYEAPVTDEERDGFANYADASIGQFGTESTVYEVWNEWNWRKREEPAKGSAETYVALLRTTSDHVRPIHPDARLIGPALSPALTTWREWIDDFIAAGGLDYIDAFSIHPYVQTTTPEATLEILGTVRGKLDAAGHADLPIVFSEQGWNTSTGQNHVTESAQSANLVRAQLLSIAEGVEQYAIYDFKDDGLDPAEPEHHFGMIGHEDDLRGAYRPKPAYVSQALLSHRINGLSALGWSELAEDVYDVRFDAGDGETLHAVWSAGQPTTVSLASTGPITVHDLYGAEEELVPDGSGNVYVATDGEPVFVQGAIGAADVSVRHSLAVTEAFTGLPTKGVWTIDLTGSATGFDGSITIDDVSTPATVAAGERAEIPVELSPADRVGTHTWRGAVTEGGEVVARLSASREARAALEVTGSHALTPDGEDVLRLRARNNTSAPMTVDDIQWTVGSDSGTALTGQDVAAGEAQHADVPVDVVEALPWTATLRTETGEHIVEGVLRPTGDRTVVPWAQVELDGVVDPLVAGLTAADLPAPDDDDWGGASDLSGRLWWTRDAETAYLTAEVVDDVAAQPATGADIWQGDSVQVGIVAGAPGETARAHEVGVGLTDSGDLQVWRWAPKDLGTDLAGVRGAAVRDDAAGTTTYELAIPLASLPAMADDGLVSATVVVNENDGAGRTGWASWGHGVAESKDSAKYHALALAGPVLTGLSTQPATLTLPQDVVAAVTATGQFSDGSTKDLTESVAWSSSDTAIATVSPTGDVTAVAPGSATVIATSGSASVELAVTVTDATLQTITLTPTLPRVPVGTDVAFTATGRFSDGTTHDLTGQVSWTSWPTRVATIDDGGLASAKATGTTLITARLGDVTGFTPLLVVPRR